MIIDRYIFKLWLPSFIGFLLVITGLLMFGRVIRAIEAFGQNPVDWLILGQMVWSILPYFLTLTIPFAFFFALLRTMTHLQQNSEIDALLAAGISPLRLLRPAAGIAAFFALFLLWISMSWVPSGQKMFVALSTAIKQSSAIPSFIPQQFSQGLNGLTLYYAGENAQGRLQQFMLEDKRGVIASIYLAKTATMERNSNFLMLTMYDGVHLEGKGAALRATRFSEFSLTHDIGDAGIVMPAEVDVLKPSMMTMHQLFEAVQTYGAGIDVVAEWHKRLSLPLSIVVLLLFAFPLSSSPKRAGKSYALLWGISLVLLLYNVQIVVHKQVLLQNMQWWMIWLTQFLFMGAAVVLFIFYQRFGHIQWLSYLRSQKQRS